MRGTLGLSEEWVGSLRVQRGRAQSEDQGGGLLILWHPNRGLNQSYAGGVGLGVRNELQGSLGSESPGGTITAQDYRVTREQNSEKSGDTGLERGYLSVKGEDGSYVWGPKCLWLHYVDILGQRMAIAGSCVSVLPGVRSWGYAG